MMTTVHHNANDDDLGFNYINGNKIAGVYFSQIYFPVLALEQRCSSRDAPSVV